MNELIPLQPVPLGNPYESTAHVSQVTPITPFLQGQFPVTESQIRLSEPMILQLQGIHPNSTLPNPSKHRSQVLPT